MRIIPLKTFIYCITLVLAILLEGIFTRYFKYSIEFCFIFIFLSSLVSQPKFYWLLYVFWGIMYDILFFNELIGVSAVTYLATTQIIPYLKYNIHHPNFSELWGVFASFYLANIVIQGLLFQDFIIEPLILKTVLTILAYPIVHFIFIKTFLSYQVPNVRLYN